MGKKLEKVYDALVNGAANGLTGDKLYAHIQDQCPKTPSKRVVKASLFALSDPDVKDRRMLEAIYALAIKYRLSSLGVDESVNDGDEEDAPAPSVSQKLKNKLESTVSDIPALNEDVATPQIAKSVH